MGGHKNWKAGQPDHQSTPADLKASGTWCADCCINQWAATRPGSSDPI